MQALAAGLDPTLRLSGDEWWRGAIGYEVYVRSFADGDGDGTGDLAGITDRLGYLAKLGIDVVWLTPFFPGPGHDHGYDVSSYVDVHPMHGTLADWDRLVATAHELGLRVFVDIVPNHTSSEHPWFRAAISDPAGPFRDYYVWADPGVDGGPPNNWVSHFGGPAWSLDPAGSGQYYCHLFLPEQPDLNWANPKVTDEFQQILRFWCERGADGFRIDVAHGLSKDPALRSNPQRRAVTPDMHPMEVFASFEHIHDLHRRETAQLFRAWRDAVAPYGAVLVGEMDTRDVARFAEYVAAQDALHAAFVLQVGLTDWDPAATLDAMDDYQRRSNGGVAWEVSNHDQARATSRYGGGAVGLRRALALSTLMVAYDGMFFIYQGEELGLLDAVLRGGPEDPMAARNGDHHWGRDVARGAMPWATGANQGFGGEPWLPTEPVADELTVESQLADDTSTWYRYRDLAMLRKRFPALFSEPFQQVERGREHVVVSRGDVLTVANLSEAPIRVGALVGAEVLFSSSGEVPSADGTVAAVTTVVARVHG